MPAGASGIMNFVVCYGVCLRGCGCGGRGRGITIEGGEGGGGVQVTVQCLSRCSQLHLSALRRPLCCHHRQASHSGTSKLWCKKQAESAKPASVSPLTLKERCFFLCPTQHSQAFGPIPLLYSSGYPL